MRSEDVQYFKDLMTRTSEDIRNSDVLRTPVKKWLLSDHLTCTKFWLVTFRHVNRQIYRTSHKTAVMDNAKHESSSRT